MKCAAECAEPVCQIRVKCFVFLSPPLPDDEACVFVLLRPVCVNCVFNSQSSQETVKSLVILTQLRNFRCSTSSVESKAELKLLFASR